MLQEITARAVEVLARGGLVVLPTETVYGLAANATDDRAVACLFSTKSRAAEKALVVLMADAAGLTEFAAEVPPGAEALATRFWPGPLTVVVLKSPVLSDLVTGGRPTVGLRVPDHDLTRLILRTAGFPVAMTSANLSGAAEPVTADQAWADLGGVVDLLIDDGPCPGGVPSTVVDMTSSPPRLLRLGPVSRADLERIIGPVEA